MPVIPDGLRRTNSPRYYSTSFSGTENPLSEGGLWTNGGAFGVSSMRKSGGLCYGTQVVNATVPPYVDSIAAYTSGVWGPDQWVIGTVFSQNPQNGSSTTFQELELWVRVTFGPDSTLCKGYDTNIRVVTDGSGYCQIGRRNGTVNDTNFAGGSDNTVTGITLATGNRIALSVIGNTIRVYKDSGGGFSLINSAVDTTYPTGGAPGIGHWQHGPDGAINDYGFTFWEASDRALF